MPAKVFIAYSIHSNLATYFCWKIASKQKRRRVGIELVVCLFTRPSLWFPFFNLMKDSSLKIGFETREYYYYNQPKQALAKDRECLMFPFYHAQTFYEYFISTRLTSYQMESYFSTCSVWILYNFLLSVKIVLCTCMKERRVFWK